MKTLFHQTVLVAALCSLLAMSLPSAAASGIPTVDVAAIAQMAQQLQQLKTQYELLRQQLRISHW